MSLEFSELKVFVKERFQDIDKRLSNLEDVVREIPEKLTAAIPKAVREELMDHFRIEGVAPVNMADVRTAVTESESRVVARLEDFGARFTNLLASNTSSSVISEHTVEAVESGGGSSIGEEPSFRWGGRLHCFVPQGFQFPSGIDTKTMWDLWHFGNSMLHIGPYRKMEKYVKFDLDKQGRTRFSKTKGLMKIIDAEILKQKVVPSIEALERLHSDRAQTDAIFSAAFKEVMKQLYPDEGKRGKGAGTSVTALRNKMSEDKKRKAVQTEDVRVTEAEYAARDAMLQLQRPVLETDTSSSTIQLQQILAFPPVSEIRSLSSGPVTLGLRSCIGQTPIAPAHPAGNTLVCSNAVDQPLVKKNSRSQDRCEFSGCLKKRTYGWEDGVERFCNIHKFEGMLFHCKHKHNKRTKK